MLFDIILKGKYEGETLKSYPLYVELSKFSRADKSEYQMPDLMPKIEFEDEEGKDEDLVPYEPRRLRDDGLNWQQRGWRRDYDHLDETMRNNMLIDETFSLYLYKISLKTNPNYYKTILAFVIFFRECLNQIGWAKRIQSEEIDLD
jgi:hypothetical protein